MKRSYGFYICLPLCFLCTVAAADQAQVWRPAVTSVPPVSKPQPATAAAVYAPAPDAPAYSIPWGLRGILPINILRLDSAIGFYNRPNGGGSGQTVVFMPSVGYKFTPNLVGLWRWGIVGNAPPKEGLPVGAVSIGNMFAGAMYARKLPAGFRFSFLFGSTIPIGTGGAGNAMTGTGDPHAAEATKMALYTRESMDNIMWSPNDFSLIEGIDLAYVWDRLTVQFELTFFELMRVKNEATQVDAFRVNSTYGLHIGYFATPWLSLAGELRYQRFLSTPDAVAKDATMRDNLSMALGPRFHVQIKGGWLRPSIAYAPGLHGYIGTNHYHVLILDFPYIF